MTKRIAAALALCLLLASCGAGGTAEMDEESGGQTAWSAEQIAWSVWTSQEASPAASRGMAFGEAEFENYLAAYYALAPEIVEDGYLRCAGGISAAETAVLRFREGTDMEAVREALLAYQESRAGDFTGYLPEQAELVEQGAVLIRGSWAALLLCAQPDAARDAFDACFGAGATTPPTPRWGDETAAVPEEPEPERTPETAPQEKAAAPRAEETPQEPAQLPVEPGQNPPSEGSGDPPAESPAKPVRPPAETEPPVTPPAGEPEAPAPPVPPANVYDGAAVRAAWDSGDESGLSEKSRAVLAKAREVIDGHIQSGMSAYQKELAIHDWMVGWGSYDHGELSHLPGEEGQADNENPYGFLVGGKGICLGYASTFQLFMDLLDIPCRTVHGTAHAGTADHAWNLVRLDGEWYGVDVTWDDPTTHMKVTSETAHRYFNVTSRFLRDNDHQWDADGIPEAEGTAWAWEK